MSETPDNPWREFVENVISGDNYFRSSEYHELLDYIDGLIVSLAAVTRERDEARTEVEFRMADSVALVAAQERIKSLEMDLAEKERPLDAEMARLNQNLIAANDAALKAGLERNALRAEVERLCDAIKGLASRLPLLPNEPADDYVRGYSLGMRDAIKTISAALQEPTP